MSIGAIGTRSLLQVQSLLDLRAQLDDLQRQLGTGKKAEDYAGLGLDRGLSVGLRSQLSAVEAFEQTIVTLGARLKITQTALTDIRESARIVKSAALLSAFAIDDTGQTTEQKSAYAQLDQILGLLNTRFGDQYVFSGLAADRPAVETLDRILNGDGVRAGLRQVIAERNQADLGADGLGRLVMPPLAASPARIVGAGAAIAPDAVAIVSGLQDVSALLSAGGSLVLNGAPIAINPGDNATAIRDAINLQQGVTGVSALIDGSNRLVLTSANADTAVDIGAGTSASLLAELGLSVGAANPSNLLTQGAVAPGETLSVTVGANPPLAIVFGNGPGEVSTLAELALALQGLAGGTAAVDLSNGNITIAALTNTDSIVVGGTAAPATFGIQNVTAAPMAGTRVTLNEDAAGSPFGFKLASLSSSLSGAFVSGPGGVPPGIAIDLQAIPPPGGALKITLTQPDGVAVTLSFTATANPPLDVDQFAIGATPAATAANLRAALSSALGALANTSLSAASAMAAANDFFNIDDANPPQRVNGPPFSAATSLVAGTSADTIIWYTGEGGAGSARSTAAARIDTSVSVRYGMRANEQALRTAVANIAVFAAVSFSATDQNAPERYAALSYRVQDNLNLAQGAQQLSHIQADIAAAQATIEAAEDRHRQTAATVTDLLDSIEGVSMEEVGAQILALQTSLQASLQTTALLAKTNLVDYL